MTIRPRTRWTAVAATGALAVALAGCGADTETGAPATVTAVAPSTAAAGASSNASPGSSAPAAGQRDLATAKVAVSWRDAVNAAKDEAAGEPTKIELGWDNGQLVYEIELFTDTELVDESFEHELNVDAVSGRVLKKRSDRLDADDRAEARAEVIDTAGIVEPADAMRTALASRPGRVTEWTLDRDSSGTTFEIDITGTDGHSGDVEVDAHSGQLVTGR